MVDHQGLITAEPASATKPSRNSWANGSAVLIVLVLVPVFVWHEVGQSRRIDQLECIVGQLQEALEALPEECSRPRANNVGPVVHNEAKPDKTEVGTNMNTGQAYETGPLMQKIMASIIRGHEYSENEERGVMSRNSNEKGNLVEVDFDADMESSFPYENSKSKGDLGEYGLEDDIEDIGKDRVKRGKKKGEKKGKKRKGEKGEKGEPGEPGQASSVIAAHFVGDRQNGGVVEIKDGTINFWKYADWMTNDDKSKFRKNIDGEIIVEEAGLYYVYSQVTYKGNPFVGHYIDIGGDLFFRCINYIYSRAPELSSCYTGGLVHVPAQSTVTVKIQYEAEVQLTPVTTFVLYYDDKNMSHAVSVDDDAILSCTHTAYSGAKYNTCFTGGIARFQQGSKLKVHIRYPDRVINMSPDSTFVGLVKLS